MRHPALIVALIAVLTFVAPAQAQTDIWTQAYNDARSSRTANNNAAVTLLNVNTSNNGGPLSRYATSDVVYYDEDNAAPLQPGASQNTYQLSGQAVPWGWNWFPYYQCMLSFWQTTSESGVPMSPLEKYDTLAVNMGGTEAYAAAFEASDTRWWIAQQRGMPQGHNLARAMAEAGGKTTIPWYVQGQNNTTSQTTVDMSWWGHCNGWCAAAVSFPENQLTDRRVQLSQGKLRFLRRPPFSQAAADTSSVTGGLANCYDERSAQTLTLASADLKSILTEYGMQLRPSAEFTAGRRYEAPTCDVEEYYFERRSDGTVIIPKDAQMMWVSLMFDGKNVGGWVIPTNVDTTALQNWRVQVEQYYRYYYPNHQIYTLLTVRYTNLPMSPSQNDLRDLPPLVRRSFLDSYPLDVHDKMVKAFSGNGGQAHGMIAEVMAGVQVWNYPVCAYSYKMSAIGETVFNTSASFAPGRATDASSLFNLLQLDATKLPTRNNQKIIRYRLGTINLTLQKVNKVEVDRHEFIAFYDGNDTPLGSSWTGDSLTNHPDFIWYPDLNNPASQNGCNPYVKGSVLKQVLPNLTLR